MYKILCTVIIIMAVNSTECVSHHVFKKFPPDINKYKTIDRDIFISDDDATYYSVLYADKNNLLLQIYFLQEKRSKRDIHQKWTRICSHRWSDVYKNGGIYVIDVNNVTKLYYFNLLDKIDYSDAGLGIIYDKTTNTCDDV